MSPRKINFEDVARLDIVERRRQLFINIWRSVPGTTDRIIPIDKTELENLFWKAFLETCRAQTDLADVFRETHDKCAYPWQSDITELKGKCWLTLFMRATLLLDGFLPSMDGMDRKRRLEKIKQLLQEEIIDDWVPEHDRLLKEAADNHLYDPVFF
ncbi:hypothetical protein BKA66DRAFT_273288 [Pyrenochaeta sp. MPI-SDFR-AT-0127]|nr:hypothetical protein BKA66DRAFT_273288 [Pyrenochaeta sp. MPI-SDFR-AT-0127]